MTYRTRTGILLGMVVCSGFVWNMGTDFGLVFAHLLAPVTFAIITALAFDRMSLTRRAILLVAAIFLAEITRLGVYSCHGGMPYITGDGETWLAILVSLAVQLILSCLTLLAASYVLARIRR